MVNKITTKTNNLSIFSNEEKTTQEIEISNQTNKEKPTAEPTKSVETEKGFLVKIKEVEKTLFEAGSTPNRIIDLAKKINYFQMLLPSDKGGAQLMMTFLLKICDFLKTTGGPEKFCFTPCDTPEIYPPTNPVVTEALLIKITTLMVASQDLPIKLHFRISFILNKIAAYLESDTFRCASANLAFLMQDLTSLADVLQKDHGQSERKKMLDYILRLKHLELSEWYKRLGRKEDEFDYLPPKRILNLEEDSAARLDPDDNREVFIERIAAKLGLAKDLIKPQPETETAIIVKTQETENAPSISIFISDAKLNITQNEFIRFLEKYRIWAKVGNWEEKCITLLFKLVWEMIENGVNPIYAFEIADREMMELIGKKIGYHQSYKAAWSESAYDEFSTHSGIEYGLAKMELFQLIEKLANERPIEIMDLDDDWIITDINTVLSADQLLDIFLQKMLCSRGSEIALSNVCLLKRACRLIRENLDGDLISLLTMLNNEADSLLIQVGPSKWKNCIGRKDLEKYRRQLRYYAIPDTVIGLKDQIQKIIAKFSYKSCPNTIACLERITYEISNFSKNTEELKKCIYYCKNLLFAIAEFPITEKDIEKCEARLKEMQCEKNSTRQKNFDSRQTDQKEDKDNSESERYQIELKKVLKEFLLRRNKNIDISADELLLEFKKHEKMIDWEFLKQLKQQIENQEKDPSETSSSEEENQLLENCRENEKRNRTRRLSSEKS